MATGAKTWKDLFLNRFRCDFISNLSIFHPLIRNEDIRDPIFVFEFMVEKLGYFSPLFIPMLTRHFCMTEWRDLCLREKGIPSQLIQSTYYQNGYHEYSISYPALPDDSSSMEEEHVDLKWCLFGGNGKKVTFHFVYITHVAEDMESGFRCLFAMLKRSQ